MILDIDKDARRKSKSELLSALSIAGANTHNPRAIRCPFHEDQTASAGVYEDDDGIWRFKCHGAGCGFSGDIYDVQEKITGKSPAQQLSALRAEKTTQAKLKPTTKRFASLSELRKIRHVKEMYCYNHPQTLKTEMVVLRIEPPDAKKTFLQARPDGAGYALEAPEKPWPIYNRKRVAAAPEIIIVEGEKCVHAVTVLDYVATTSPGGAGKAKHADWSLLAGKTVYLWPDNDPPNKEGISGGVEHMRDVARILQTLDPAPKVFWVDIKSLALPPKGDVVDYLDQFGQDREDRRVALQAALSASEATGAAGELSKIIEDEIAGRRINVPWPWGMLTHLTRALLPGTVTCICGDAGATKSFMLLQSCHFWHCNGIKTAIYELEEDRPYHIRRLLAQLAGKSDITDPDWVRNNPDDARATLGAHKSTLDDFGKCVYAAPDEHISLDQVQAWVLQMASCGCRVIVVDPITAAATDDKPWISDLKFIMAVKTIMRRHGASLVLVTHPRKGKRIGSSLHDLAGGAAYQRFSQTVMWIDAHKQPKNVMVKTVFCAEPATINRSIQLHKTRNSHGTKLELGYTFHGGSLSFTEHGIVTGDAEEIP